MMKWTRTTEILFPDTHYPRTVHYWVAETNPADDFYYVIERGFRAYEGYVGYMAYRLPKTHGFWDKDSYEHHIGFANVNLAAAKAQADENFAARTARRLAQAASNA